MTTDTRPSSAAPLPTEDEVVLEVSGLDVDIRTPKGTLRAVNDVSFTALSGRTIALLGESGCGKSMTAKAIAGLLDPVASVTGGEVNLSGTDLAALTPRQRLKFAGPELGIVFQDALTALNPVYTVGTQLGEAFRIHRGLSAKAAKAKKKAAQPAKKQRTAAEIRVAAARNSRGKKRRN